VTVARGADVTCTITNTLPGSFDVAKSSDPPSGSTVAPGATITYTVTARKLAGVDPQDVVVDDDMSAVLAHASLVAGSITASAGAAELDGTTLRWAIPALQGTQTVTYQVVVAPDADDVRLTNVVTSPGSETCVPPADQDDASAADVAEPAALATAAGIRAGTGTAAMMAAATVADPDDVCSTTHVTPGPSPTTPPTSPPTAAPPAPPGTPGYLPTTGGPGAGPALVSLALLALGAALVLAARRRGGRA